MPRNNSDELGTKSIHQLIISQSVPAGIGILVMSLNLIVDTIFVGNYIGSVAIAVITVVLPIVFLISAMGMAIGVGGASIISRALGANDKDKAIHTFGNQIILAVSLSILLSILGLVFREEALSLFGAQGNIMEPAKIYYTILMFGVPFLAMVMTANPIIRAEGMPQFSMMAMVIPSFANIIMDYLFVVRFNYGIQGAGWATIISYFSSFVFIFWFFASKHSELKLKLKCFRLEWNIVKEIASLGGVTLARQGVVSFLSIILNNALYRYGGENSLAVYGIISRMLMFSLFPIMGIAQGFMPIAGYNYGAQKYARVKETISKSIIYATVLALGIFVLIMLFPSYIVRIFTDDLEIIKQTPNALRMVFGMTPLIAIQLVGAGYFQAIGKAKPALFLTLTKQGFFLIPLLLILPQYYGLIGIWIAFPIADFLSTIITGYFLKKEMSHLT